MPFVRPYVATGPALIERLASVLASGQLSNDGANVRELETLLSNHLGAHVLAVNSGTAALEGALSLIDGTGGVVIPSFTFLATANAVVTVGREVVLCDVDPDHWTLDPVALARILDERNDIAAVVAVNVYGQPAPMAEILAVCAPRGVDVLIDNAHGFGSLENGVAWPNGVRAVAHSLHATKVLPAAEGGFIAVSSEADATFLRRRRNHGLAATPSEIVPGVNAKLSELHAAVALACLNEIDEILSLRREHLAILRDVVLSLPGRPLQLQKERPGVVENGQNFVVATAAAVRERWIDAFAELGIGTRRYFWPSMSAVPAFAGAGATPLADSLSERVLALPLWSRMSPDELKRVADGIVLAAQRCRELP